MKQFLGLFNGTKNISFVASQITAGQTRSLTVIDRDTVIGDARLDDTILITPPTNADYTLTDAENQYGRIEVDTTNWTIARNIIMNNNEHTFLAVVNNTGSQNATFKTSAGTGILVESGLNLGKQLRNDTTNVIDFEIASSSSALFLQLKSVKIVSTTGTALIPSDDTVPLISEGTEVASLDITPANTANKILIQCNANIGHSLTDENIAVAVFRDSVCIFAGTRRIDSAVTMSPAGIHVVDTPATVSAITYSIRMGTLGAISGSWEWGGSGTARLGSAANGDDFTLTEISGV
jgi:hypothetical protein